MRIVGLWAVVVLLVAPGCRGGETTRPGSLAGARDEATRLRAHLKRHPDDDVARRDLALIEWTYLAEPERARKAFHTLVARGDVHAAGAALVMAWARDDLGATWESAELILTTVSGTERPDPALESLGELAARRLNDVMGEDARDDARFVKLFDALDIDDLPYRVRQPMLSARASLARRRDEPYRQYFRQQGCLQEWDVGVLEGIVGALDIPATEETPFRRDAGAALAQLACVVRVWNPTPRAGVRRLQTWVEVAGDVMRLEVSAEEASRVYVDGELIHRTDRTDRWVAKYTTLDVPVKPGPHLVQVTVAVPSERAWLLVRATEANGDPVALPGTRPSAPAGVTGKPSEVRAPWAEPTAPLDGPYHEPYRLALALEDALDEDDPDLAERLGDRLRKHETFAEGMWLVSRMERADPSRGQTASATREQRALTAALDLDPGLDAARLRALEIQRGRGEDAEVRQTLDAVGKGGLDSVAGQLFRWRVYRTLGDELRARQALDRASGDHPDHCDVLMARRTEAQARDATPTEDELVEKLATCSGSIKLRARLAETRGRWDVAEALWRQSLERVPDDTPVMASLADVAVARGKPEEAIRWHEAILALNPYRVGSQIAIADLLIDAGKLEDALDRVRTALEMVPQSSSLRRTAESVGIEDDLLAYREDGRAAWLAYQESGKKYEGVSEVLVLDRTVARVYPNGGMRMIVHLVVHLSSKEALDSYGEVSVPQGATLLTLRSIKPDGTILEPESIPGKDGLSLRDLEIGDAVDYEYVVDREPAGLLPGYVDVTTFRFQSPDIPYHHSELVVVHPPHMKMREEGRNDPPKVTVTEKDGLTVRTWLAREMPRLGVEPHMRAPLDELPNVRVFTDLSMEAWLRTVSMQLRDGQRANPELRRLVKRLVRGKKAPRDRLMAVWKWIMKNVEDTADLSSSATATLAARRGNRMMLLRTMLREAGIRAELWLAANRFGPAPRKGGHPMVEAYDTPLLAVWLEDEATRPLMVLTASRVLPVGYIAPAFAGGRGVRVQLDEGDGPFGHVRLPKPPASMQDRRAYDLRFELDGSGDGSASGTLELQGMEALAWRQALEEIDRDRVEEAFQQAELARLGRGLTLQSLEITNEKVLDQPLVLTFEARVDGAGVVQGGELVVPAGMVPMNSALPYTGLPRRKTGLIVNYGPIQEARIEIRFSGARLARVPEAVSIETDQGLFERKVSGGPGDAVVTLELRSRLTPGVVEPERYGELTRLAQGVEAAERAVISVRPDAAGS